MATCVVQRPDRDDIWARIEELVNRAPSLDALRAHHLQLLAPSLWREQGRIVPQELEDELRFAAKMTVAAPMVLKRARAAYEGRLMLMKGPEVAARYPTPAARRFRDLDLLADEPDVAQRALLDAGFVELQTGHDYSDDQHLCPLVWPGLPLVVELHRRPNCEEYLTPPPRDELMAMAVPSATGVDELLAPAPAAHALLLVAHAWTHLPLGRAGRSHRPGGDAPGRRASGGRRAGTPLGLGAHVADHALRGRCGARARSRTATHCAGGRATSPRFGSSRWWRTTCSGWSPPRLRRPPGARRVGSSLHCVTLSVPVLMRAGLRSSIAPPLRRDTRSRASHSMTAALA